ncbi:MAG: pyridoxamine 5'-phosphate oxidase family protein [Blastocatellia bacterium]
MITRLSAEETTEILARGRIGRLGCIDDRGPYVVPVSYIFRGDAIFAHSLNGRKISALRADPRTCMQVDEIKDDFHWRSAIAFGSYEEVKGPDERKSVLDELFVRYRNLTPIEAVPPDKNGPEDVVVFKINVESVSGVGEP